MNEPQVPLYCITSEIEVAAAALVQLRTGSVKVLGLGPAGVLPDMKRMDAPRDSEIQDELRGWKDALEDLARRFQAGEAMVDPKHKACEFCKLPSLCRIKELNHAG